ncbi:MAG: DUF1330 domain-containing protein [Burkholderiales bacterium]
MAKAHWICCYRSTSNPDALAAHDSAGYQAALKALNNRAERDLRIVEGV